MAYDPEARQTSNMALVVGIIILVIVVGGAIAYLTSRPSPVETAPPAIIHDQTPAPTPQIVPVPVPVPNSNPAPSVTITPPASHSSTSTTTTIEKKEVAPPSGSIDTSSNNGKSSTSSTTPRTAARPACPFPPRTKETPWVRFA